MFWFHEEIKTITYMHFSFWIHPHPKLIYPRLDLWQPSSFLGFENEIRRIGEFCLSTIIVISKKQHKIRNAFFIGFKCLSIFFPDHKMPWQNAIEPAGWINFKGELSSWNLLAANPKVNIIQGFLNCAAPLLYNDVDQSILYDLHFFFKQNQHAQSCLVNLNCLKYFLKLWN